MEYCPITGETDCKCGKPQYKISSMKVDLKATLRKLFTDHAVYTKFVLNDIVDGVSSVNAFLNRLLDNQVDIGNQLKAIIGEEAGNTLTYLLQQHIKLAGEVIKSAAGHDDENVLQRNVNELFENSNKVAEFLSSLNPEQLPYDVTESMFHTHNQFVIDMTISRLNGQHEEEQRLYDAYYNEILELSDAIYNAL